MEKSIKYLVAHDFTPAGDSALKSAIRLKENNGGEIFVLHVVSSRAEIQNANKKLEEIASEYAVFFRLRVEVGKLNEVVGSFTKTHNINYILFGTHGQKGIQRVLGSNALKMVSLVDKPFLITQAENELKGLKNIVLTYSYDKESIQVNKFIEDLAKNNNAKIHLVGFQIKDEDLRWKTITNELVMGNFLRERNIDFEIVKLPGEKKYNIELFEYADQVNADLIATAFFNGSKVALFKNFVQDLITNDKKVPVLTANAETMAKVYF